MNSEIRCLAIVDGDDRGIVASLYLDHNLGAEKSIPPERAPGRTLAGSQFSLIRDEILQARREAPEAIQHDPPHVLAFMGGTDPNALVVDVVAALSRSDLHLTLTAICAAGAMESVVEIARENPNIEVLGTTNELPKLLSRADTVISASGTSVWELCTLGIPSLVLATVDNQLRSLAAVRDAGVAYGIDATGSLVAEDFVAATRTLLTDDGARHQLAARCRDLFDGLGKDRVAEAMEMMLA
ncbi:MULTISPECIES: glycosyltransferase [unclassified Cryobacterium]|uniref:glycosyltransferase n=1 Tax=unclassified Cryobacterium TaxID=2649013 RepID=UPI0014480EE2|nr:MULTISPECIES: glycosyltransferase [unclassified Cryobacterium]